MYYLDIEPVLKELQDRELNDSQAARKALEFLEQNVTKANDLVEKYKYWGRFYLLLKRRNIVKEVQDVTRNIRGSLATLSLASTEVLMNISDKVNRLHTDMREAEFQTSQTHLQIVNKLTRGIEEQKADQGFANDILEQIARAVGVPIEPLEISKELASVTQEKEDAAASKNRAEEYFRQVIELLSRADAAKNQEEIKKHYFQRVGAVEKIMQEIQPLPSFICPIKCRDVMVDPVSLCTGTTCERAAIESWFEQGKRIDPETGNPLDDLSLRSNNRLRESIEEWRELNNCLKIRVAKKKLQSEVDSTLKEALVQMQEMMTESPITKDWISIEGFIEMCLSILKRSHDKDVEMRVLVVLKATMEGHITNKEKLIESEGIQHIVPCLGSASNVARAAVELLFDLLHDGNGWNVSASKKLSEESSAIIFLVMLMNNKSIGKAETILLKLCNDDDKNVIGAAKANWYKPVVDRLLQERKNVRSLNRGKAIVIYDDIEEEKSVDEGGSQKDPTNSKYCQMFPELARDKLILLQKSVKREDIIWYSCTNEEIDQIRLHAMLLEEIYTGAFIGPELIDWFLFWELESISGLLKVNPLEMRKYFPLRAFSFSFWNTENVHEKKCAKDTIEFQLQRGINPSTEYLFVPMLTSHHQWTLLYFDFDNLKWHHYNSFKSNKSQRNQHARAAKRFMNYLSELLLFIIQIQRNVQEVDICKELIIDDGKFQMNGEDSGLYVCNFLKKLVLGEAQNWNGEEINQMRVDWVTTILTHVDQGWNSINPTDQ